jgi:hypothetical protein
MRLIHTYHKSSGVTARVFHSAEYEEFIVRFYDGKEHFADLDYISLQREDALLVARVQLSEMDEITE